MSGERPVTYEQPFMLLSKTQDVTRPVTLADVSEQVGALSGHLGAVHREVALTRSELRDLSALVTGDHAPRITAVEKTTVGKIKGVAGWVGFASLVVTAAAQIAATFKPSMVGPIQAIGQMLAGLQ